MIDSVVLADGIHLLQNGIYRGRIKVLAPKFLATEDVVRGKLQNNGFADIVFYDKSALPADWPDEQKADDATTYQWTAYLEGRFAETDRVIPFSELSTNMTLGGMWLERSPAAQTAATPTAEPPPAAPVIASMPVDTSGGAQVPSAPSAGQSSAPVVAPVAQPAVVTQKPDASAQTASAAQSPRSSLTGSLLAGAAFAAAGFALARSLQKRSK